MYLIGVGDWRLISTFINESCKTCLLSKFTSGYNSCMDGDARKQRILNDWKLDNYWNNPHSAYSKPWPCPERTPDGSCRCSEHKGFLVCAGVYQCLNRTGGSTGTPYQQLIRAPGFPCTFAGLLSLPSSISTKLKIARPGCTALR